MPVKPGLLITQERLAELGRILAVGLVRLTLLAPDNVEAILAGRQPVELTMAKAMQPFPVEWKRQSFA